LALVEGDGGALEPAELVESALTLNVIVGIQSGTIGTVLKHGNRNLAVAGGAWYVGHIEDLSFKRDWFFDHDAGWSATPRSAFFFGAFSARNLSGGHLLHLLLEREPDKDL
jgi:hypothetical protein